MQHELQKKARVVFFKLFLSYFSRIDALFRDMTHDKSDYFVRITGLINVLLSIMEYFAVTVSSYHSVNANICRDIRQNLFELSKICHYFLKRYIAIFVTGPLIESGI